MQIILLQELLPFTLHLQFMQVLSVLTLIAGRCYTHILLTQTPEPVTPAHYDLEGFLGGYCPMVQSIQIEHFIPRLLCTSEIHFISIVQFSEPQRHIPSFATGCYRCITH
ncbi:MAG: hypothetical protein K6E86_02650 [Bacteroidales bacterium]|nr:hypothetical protein [Bacteroidales bacterium]